MTDIVEIRAEPAARRAVLTDLVLWTLAMGGSRVLWSVPDHVVIPVLQQYLGATLPGAVKRSYHARGNEKITTINGSEVRWFSRGSQGHRGYAADLLILDEAERVTEAYLASIVPVMAGRPGARLVKAYAKP